MTPTQAEKLIQRQANEIGNLRSQILAFSIQLEEAEALLTQLQAVAEEEAVSA